MKKIAFMTAGYYARKCCELMLYEKSFECCYFIESDIKKIGQSIFGKKVISIFKAKEMYELKKIDTIIIPNEFEYKEIKKMINQFKQLGFSKKDIFIIPKGFLNKKEACVSNNLNEFYNGYLPYLYYLEYHVADHCNLNCKGCNNFSPLVKKEVFPEFCKFENDIKQLKKLIEDIIVIRILGGEPLLNPELYKYVELTKKVYPNSDLRIVTNGILVKSMDENLIKTIKKNDVLIELSIYPPIIGEMDEILDFLERNSIKYSTCDGLRTQFYPILRKKARYEFENTKPCVCTALYDGHIATCSYPFFSKYFNKYFDEKLPVNQGIIDIYDGNLTPEILLEQLNKPITFCEHCICARQPEHFPMQKWELAKRDKIEKMDWYLKE